MGLLHQVPLEEEKYFSIGALISVRGAVTSDSESGYPETGALMNDASVSKGRRAERREGYP